MNNIDDLIKLERIIKTTNYPTLQDLMKKTGKSKNTVLSNIEKINEYYESKYEELEGKVMIKNSKAQGKQGYFYSDSSYSLSIEDFLDPTTKIEQDEKRYELIEFLKDNVTRPGIAHPNVDEKIKESIRDTEKRLDRCKTLEQVLFFYDDACASLHGKNDVATELQKHGLMCFESPGIAKIVDGYRRYL